MITTLTIIAIAVLVTYLAIAISLFGIPSSISNTYYLYESKHKGLGYVFTLFMWCEAVLLTIIMLTIGEHSPLQFLGFLSPAGLAFCGCAVLSKGVTLESKVHIAGALIGAVCGLIWCIVFGGLIRTFGVFLTLNTICLLVAYMTDSYDDSLIFWVEVISFGTMAIMLLLI